MVWPFVCLVRERIGREVGSPDPRCSGGEEVSDATKSVEPSAEATPRLLAGRSCGMPPKDDAEADDEETLLNELDLVDAQRYARRASLCPGECSRCCSWPLRGFCAVRSRRLPTRQPHPISQPHCCRIIAILENALAKLSVLEKITPDEPEEGQQVHGAYNVYHLRPTPGTHTATGRGGDGGAGGASEARAQVRGACQASTRAQARE